MRGHGGEGTLLKVFTCPSDPSVTSVASNWGWGGNSYAGNFRVFGAVPGLAPVPRQVGHGADTGTVTGTWAPSTAWSNEMWTSASRSRPRSA